MDLDIAGCRAAVAAATAGLGRACAAALVAEGVQVTICGSEPRRAARAGEELGAEAVTADLTDPRAAGGFVDEARRRMGGVDILVLNGPGPPPGRAVDLDPDELRAAVEGNLLPVAAMCRAALPDMRARRWGRIVAITSLGARVPLPRLASSNAARAGVTGYLRTLAREVAPDGVTVNSVQPGLHDTARARQVYGDGFASAAAALPVGRAGTPDEFGSLVAFLCSRHAAFVTGVGLHVDGGASAGMP